jgi:hypothetical protein
MDDYDSRAVDPILEALPDAVVAGLEVRDAWRKQLAASNVGLEFVVSDLSRWPVGSVVRVAFLDGDSALHAKIAAATTPVTESANLTLDFGHDPVTGSFRRWTEADTVLQAEIRVSFDMPGYWSLVGTDSTDSTISPGAPMGGGPGQRSLNLTRFATALPEQWQGTVRHEFLHALAFKHEHQNIRGPCEHEFRWEDDSGYVPTRNSDGVFVRDAQGRRPGIYTYMAGPPNQWNRAKVNHNLRTVADPGAVAGQFDPASVMLYRFESFFYKTDPSPCAPTGPGVELSDGDKQGLALLYPAAPEAAAVLVEQSMIGLELLGAGQESVGGSQGGGARSAYGERLVELMTAHASART